MMKSKSKNFWGITIISLVVNVIGITPLLLQSSFSAQALAEDQPVAVSSGEPKLYFTNPRNGHTYYTGRTDINGAYVNHLDLSYENLDSIKVVITSQNPKGEVTQVERVLNDITDASGTWTVDEFAHMAFGTGAHTLRAYGYRTGVVDPIVEAVDTYNVYKDPIKYDDTDILGNPLIKEALVEPPTSNLQCADIHVWNNFQEITSLATKRCLPGDLNSFDLHFDDHNIASGHYFIELIMTNQDGEERRHDWYEMDYAPKNEQHVVFQANGDIVVNPEQYADAQCMIVQLLDAHFNELFNRPQTNYILKDCEPPFESFTLPFSTYAKSLSNGIYGVGLFYHKQDDRYLEGDEYWFDYRKGLPWPGLPDDNSDNILAQTTDKSQDKATTDDSFLPGAPNSGENIENAEIMRVSCLVIATIATLAMSGAAIYLITHRRRKIAFDSNNSKH